MTIEPDSVPVAEDSAEGAIPMDTRTQRINISGDTVTKATADLPEDQKLLVRWAFNYAKSNEFTWKDAERLFKVSSTTLYRVWSDKYRQPATAPGKKLDNGTRERLPNPNAGQRIALDGVCKELDRAKRLIDARGGVKKLPFIETKTYRRVEKMADEVLATSTIGMIFGDSQVGKTECVTEYARRHNHGQTLLVTCPPAAGVQLLTSEIARALHIGHSCFDKTFIRVCEALDDSRLLILDEAHMLFETYQKTSVARCLATIRQIKDRSGCGLLIVATDVFKTEAKNSEYRNTMKQFFRRGTLELNLGTEPDWQDVLAIAGHYGLATPKGETLETLRLMSREDGLGKITKYLSGAARMAAKKHQPMSWAAFDRYLKITGGMANGVQSGDEENQEAA